MMLKQNGKKFQYLPISIQITNIKIRLKNIKYRHHDNVRIMLMLLFFLKLNNDENKTKMNVFFLNLSSVTDINK